MKKAETNKLYTKSKTRPDPSLSKSWTTIPRGEQTQIYARRRPKGLKDRLKNCPLFQQKRKIHPPKKKIATERISFPITYIKVSKWALHMALHSSRYVELWHFKYRHISLTVVISSTNSQVQEPKRKCMGFEYALTFIKSSSSLKAAKKWSYFPNSTQEYYFSRRKEAKRLIKVFAFWVSKC